MRLEQPFEEQAMRRRFYAARSTPIWGSRFVAARQFRPLAPCRLPRLGGGLVGSRQLRYRLLRQLLRVLATAAKCER